MFRPGKDVKASITLAMVSEDWRGSVIDDYGRKFAELIGDQDAIDATLRLFEGQEKDQRAILAHVDIATEAYERAKTRLIYERLGPKVHYFGAIESMQDNALIDGAARAAGATAVSEAFYNEQQAIDNLLAGNI